MVGINSRLICELEEIGNQLLDDIEEVNEGGSETFTKR